MHPSKFNYPKTSTNKKAGEYYQQVYDVVCSIPQGRVSTYGAIADALSLGSARMVGYALKQCFRQSEIDIPAHRVVNSKGELSGRLAFSTPTLMQELLHAEGVSIKNNKVVNFKTVFWQPE